MEWDRLTQESRPPEASEVPQPDTRMSSRLAQTIQWVCLKKVNENKEQQQKQIKTKNKNSKKN